MSAPKRPRSVEPTAGLLVHLVDTDDHAASGLFIIDEPWLVKLIQTEWDRPEELDKLIYHFLQLTKQEPITGQVPAGPWDHYQAVWEP